MRVNAKILYVITKSNFGGAQRYVYDLACHMQKQGFVVTVLLGGEGELLGKLRDKNIQTIALPHLARDVHFGKDIISFFKMARVLHKERPHVVHLNSSKAGFMGALTISLLNIYYTCIGRNEKIKIIFTAHGWAFTEERSFAVKKILLALQWLTVRLSHETIAVSHTTKKEIAHLPHMHTIRVLPLAKEKPRFLPAPVARRDLLPRFSDKKIWIGTIAELHKNKGVLYALHATRRLISHNSSLCFVVIGDGDDKMLLTRFIEKHKLKDHVFLAGYREDASRYLPAFDIFLLPSIKEGVPYTLLEAGYAGIPVVASDIGGVREIIEHKKTGLLAAPKDVDGLTTALKELVDNAEARMRYGYNLKEKMQGRLSLSQMCEHTASCYGVIRQ